VLKDAGAALTLAHRRAVSRRSIRKAKYPSSRPKRFRTDTAAQAEQHEKLADVSADDFDAVFTPADMARCGTCPTTRHPSDRSLREGRQPVGAVCHAPAALVNVRGKDGEYLVKGKRVTGFTNAEEVGLTAVTFLLEDRLKERVASTAKPPTGFPMSKWTEARDRRIRHLRNPQRKSC